MVVKKSKFQKNSKNKYFPISIMNLNNFMKNNLI